MIYFVRDPERALVKIGYSGNAWRRFSKIQTECPGLLVLEVAIDGEPADEAALHARFADQRSRGEWFRWDGPVADHVATLQGLPRPTRRDSVKTEINRSIQRLGFGHAYASFLQSGSRQWTLPIALGVWLDCGHRVGPIVGATDEEIAVLLKFIEPAGAAAPARAA